MSGFKKTRNGMMIPETGKAFKPTAPMLPCGFCTRIIMKEREPHKKYVLISGQPMCPVCRITKKSPMRRKIARNKKAAVADVKAAEDHRRTLERKRVGQVSAESGEKYLKDLSE